MWNWIQSTKAWTWRWTIPLLSLSDILAPDNILTKTCVRTWKVLTDNTFLIYRNKDAKCVVLIHYIFFNNWKSFFMYTKSSKWYQQSTLWTHQTRRNSPIGAQEVKIKIFVPNSTSKTLHKYLISITRKINILWHTVTVELISGN